MLKHNLTAKRTLQVVVAVLALCAAMLIGPVCAHAAQAEGGLQAAGKLEVGTQASKAVNVTGKLNVKTIYTFRGSKCKKGVKAVSSKTFKSYDVTGDGKRDRLVVKTKLGQNREQGDTVLAKQIDFYVNGKKAKSMNCSYKTPKSGWNKYVMGFYGEPEYFLDSYRLRLVTLRNGTPLLHVEWIGIDPIDSFCLLQGTKSGLKTVFSPGKTPIQNTSQIAGFEPFVSSVKFHGNTVSVRYNEIATKAGWIDGTFKYSNKKRSQTLKLKSGPSNIKIIGTKKNKTKALASFKLYTSKNLKKKRCTVKAKSTVFIVGGAVSKGNLLLKVKYGSKTGWLKPWKMSNYKTYLESEEYMQW